MIARLRKLYGRIQILTLSIFFAVCASIVFSSEAPLAPSMTGRLGLLRTLAAKGLVAGGFSVNGHGQYFYSKELLNGDSYENSNESLTGTSQRIKGSEAVSFGAFDWLEFSVASLNGYGISKQTGR
jgi:hypothetical protein